MAHKTITLGMSDLGVAALLSLVRNGAFRRGCTADGASGWVPAGDEGPWFTEEPGA